MKKIKKYLGIYKAFFRASLVADLEYRLNFVFLVIAEFVWYSRRTETLFEGKICHSSFIYPTILLFYLSIYFPIRLSGWQTRFDVAFFTMLLVSFFGGCQNL